MSSEKEDAKNSKISTENESVKHESDWFHRLNPLLDKSVSPTRSHFMFSAASMFALIELEKIPESEIQNLLLDGFRMEDLTKKWDVLSLADFIDKVSVMAFSKHIRHFVEVVKSTDAPDEVKAEIIDKIMNQDLRKSWEETD